MGTEVAIAVSGPDSPLRYEQLTWAITGVERLLGVAYPSPRIEMLTDYDFGGELCGDLQASLKSGSDVHRVASVTIRLDPDACASGTRAHAEALHTIVHEAAHSWFIGNADWVDEGMAFWVERHLGATGSPWAMPESIVPQSRCDWFSNIDELEHLPPRPTTIPRVPHVNGIRPVGNYLGHQPISLCKHTLSAGLFHDLEEHLGRDAFVRGAAEIAANPERTEQPGRSMETVRTAFAAGDAQASAIIDLWYEGDPKERFYDHSDSIEWTLPPTIDASGDLVMGGKVKQGAVSIDHEDGYCSQFYLVDAKLEYEYTLLGRLPPDRTWAGRGNRIVGGGVKNGGEFEVRVDLLVPPVGDWSVVVWPKTKVSDGECYSPLMLSEVPVIVGLMEAYARTLRAPAAG